MSNSETMVSSYLINRICSTVFTMQEARFVQNEGKNVIQLLIEEAHNYFPVSSNDNTNIYSRIAKEGAKYHIGLIYATQSPSTISAELLAQTENFFVAHFDSALEADALARRSCVFENVKEKILHMNTRGLLYVKTASQRYPVPVQFSLF